MAQAIQKCEINSRNLRKCGEISALFSEDKQEFYLDCAFCEFTYLQLNTFIQHIYDHHLPELAKCRIKQEPSTEPLHSQDSLDVYDIKTEQNVEDDLGMAEAAQISGNADYTLNNCGATLKLEIGETNINQYPQYTQHDDNLQHSTRTGVCNNDEMVSGAAQNKEPSDRIQTQNTHHIQSNVDDENKSLQSCSKKNQVKPKKGKHRNWDPENMKMAIQAVRREYMGISLASKTYCVPFATLQRASRSNKSINDILSTRMGRKPVFNENAELELVKYLNEMDSTFWGLTRSDVRSLAFQIVERKNIENSFSKTKKSAGSDWLRSFLKRHKTELNVCLGKIKGGFNVKYVNKFYSSLEQAYDKYKFCPTRIYNVDETCISIVLQDREPTILAAKGERQIECMTTAERESLMTVVSCMSAAGAFVPPFFIFERNQPSTILIKHALPGADFAFEISGWMQISTFSVWFDHFLRFAQPSKQKPILLLLDGQHSHTRSIEVLDKARENGVIILSLPPQCTHKTRPVNIAFMGPLKTYYNEEIKRFMQKETREATQIDFIELFSNAYRKAQMPNIAIHGFKCTGIYPLDKNMLQKSDFVSQNLVGGKQPTEESLSEKPDSDTSSTAKWKCHQPVETSVPSKRNRTTITTDKEFPKK